MSEFLLYYKRPDPTTWVYLSSFLTIGLYFVFHRFWSIRNLDIVLLILLAPGLLMVHEGRRRHLREMESGEIATRSPSDTDHETSRPRHIVPSPLREIETSDSADQPTASSSASVLVTVNANAMQESGADTAGQAASTRPTINEETNLPLQTERHALDERLEATSLDPDQTESDAELSAKQLQRSGFIMLFAVEMLILIRLMIDPLMVRRPLLDPNLTVGGLYFISICLFIFMMVNVATSTPRMSVWQGPELGPGYALMHRLPTITTRPVSQALGGEEEPTADELDQSKRSWTILAKVLAISAHLAIIVGLVLIGNRHFGNLRSGVGCSLLYLMLPYTAQMTGRVDHALPAALLLWAVLNYRRPVFAGIFLGLAAGLVYYPLFLLPLWCSFYWSCC